MILTLVVLIVSQNINKSEDEIITVIITLKNSNTEEIYVFAATL